MSNLKDILIKDLFDSIELSVRSYNVCSNQGLTNVEELISYLKDNGDFLKLRSSGRKTDKELRELCERFVTKEELEDSFNQKDILDAYLSLDQSQRHLVEKNYLLLETKLSARTRNIINHIADGKGLESVLTALKKINYKYFDLRNAGVKTFDELENLVGRISEIISNIDSPQFLETNEKRDFLNNLKKALKKTDQFFDEFLEEQYQFLETGFFPVIKFLDLVLEHTDLIKLRDKNIAFLTKGYNLSIPTQKLVDIAPLLELSAERVRQLSTEEKIDQYFWRPIKAVLEILKTRYRNIQISHVEIGTPIFFINEDQLNNENGSSFSREFLAKLISALLNEYELINVSTDSFLVAKDVLIRFDIRKLVFEIDILVNSKRKELYSGHLKDLIVNHLKQNQAPNDWSNFEIIVKDILTNIFRIKVNSEGYFTIEPNSKMTIGEHIANVLIEVNEPLNVNSISEILRSRGIAIQPNSVRSYILRDNKFILVGPSTYALKDWESNMVLRGGTIKSLIEKYLSRNNEPKHLLDISRHITQFRSTNIQSIFRNIQSDPHDKFRYFGQMFFGLKNKEYASYEFRAINKHWFEYVTELLKKQGSLDLPTLAKDLSLKYKVPEVHVEYLLLQKVEGGRINIDSNKKITSSDK